MAAYRQVDDLSHLRASAPGPTFSSEYGKLLPLPISKQYCLKGNARKSTHYIGESWNRISSIGGNKEQKVVLV